jgi:hypothetical protein
MARRSHSERSCSGSGISPARPAARGAARSGQQHQGEQSAGFHIAGGTPAHQTGETYRVIAEVASLQLRATAARVAFVDDQIKHVQHRGEALFAHLRA